MDFKRVKRKSADEAWHCRGHLPRANVASVQFITFRLADSLPSDALARWKAELRFLPAGKRKLEIYRRAEFEAALNELRPTALAEWSKWGAVEREAPLE